ncbi:MAG: DUF2007 domain-containing protein [Planctomycetes bacterium]|nr:DUF2007 domain-containing protein [Planctomycetota bacterium]
MDEKLAVVAQYDNAEMAHLDRITLEEAGIHAVLENENLAAVSLYHVMPRCEVRLLVRQSEMEKARQVLKEVQSAESAIEDVEWTEPESEERNDKLDDPFYRGPQES